MAYAEDAQGFAKELRDIARSFVGHDPLNRDAPPFEPAQGPNEKPRGRLLFLIGQDFDIGDAGGVVATCRQS